MIRSNRIYVIRRKIRFDRPNKHSAEHRLNLFSRIEHDDRMWLCVEMFLFSSRWNWQHHKREFGRWCVTLWYQMHGPMCLRWFWFEKRRIAREIGFNVESTMAMSSLSYAFGDRHSVVSLFQADTSVDFSRRSLQGLGRSQSRNQFIENSLDLDLDLMYSASFIHIRFSVVICYSVAIVHTKKCTETCSI